MTDAGATKPAKKKASKPRKPADHPKYSEMIKQAIVALKERGGSSRQAILKYIMKNFKVTDERSANAHLKMALKAGVSKGSLKQAKGTGASGSFKVVSVKPEKKKKPETPVKSKAKKPKKVKKPKKPAAKKVKKTSPKKAAKPKKTAKPKSKPASPKKSVKPKVKKASPKKKAAKPKAAKPKTKKSSPKKKAAKK